MHLHKAIIYLPKIKQYIGDMLFDKTQSIPYTLFLLKTLTYENLLPQKKLIIPLTKSRKNHLLFYIKSK